MNGTHKLNFDGQEVPVECQIDMFLCDIKSQAEKLIEFKSGEQEEIRIMHTLALYQYIKGFHDGFRFGKPNPFKDLKETEAV